MGRRRNQDNRLSVLRRISEASGRRFDPEPLLQTAVSEVGAALAVSRCFFYQVDGAGFVRMTHEYVVDAVQSMGVGTEILDPATYLARQTSLTVKTDDTRADSRFGEAMNKQMFADLNVSSALVTPVIFQEKMFGLLGAHQCDSVRSWSDEDVELLETVSSLLSMFMQSCRVFADQQSQSDVLASMNEDLSRLYVELAAKDAQIDKFMHLISHDLRAPVVAIQGLVDLLKKGYENDPPDSKPRRFLELILHSAEQITQLTSALLEYARLGQSNLSIADVDTEELVRDIWQRFSIGAPESELAVFGALPVVRADHSKLMQIFQNLIENAFKYRNQESRLIVDVTCQETEDHWQFAVNDNGMGFHPNDAELLFDLFARLEQVRSKPGSGIGLASVMEIARLHGGTAWAVGRPGKGATFYFSLSKKILERPALVTTKT